MSLAYSLVLHLALFLVLFWLLPARPGPGTGELVRRGTVVLATIDDQTQDLTYHDSQLDDSEPQPTDKSPWADTEPPGQQALDSSSSPLLDMLPTEEGWSLPAATDLHNPHDHRGRVGVAELTEADLEAIRAEQRLMGAMTPAGPPATISLFGSPSITGQRFVFVIDRSKSMGAQGLGVLGHARSELTTALRTLAPHHCFQIVAFHHHTVMMERREMLPATEEHVHQVADFLDQLAPFGGTNYEGAIYMALALRPDAVVLFTDGDEPGLHPGQIAAIERACRGNTSIHCLQFGWEVAAPGRSFLRDLAEKTGGSYRYICVREWTQRNQR